MLPGIHCRSQARSSARRPGLGLAHRQICPGGMTITGRVCRLFMLAVVVVCGPVRHTGGVAACPVALRMSAIVSVYLPAVRVKKAAESATGTEDAKVSPTRAIM